MSSATTIRWGILGVSKINQRLIPAFKESSSSELVAIASRSLEKSQQAAAEAGIPKAYGSYEDLLADPTIDAVYIPLPNHLHAEYTRKAADAGKHILCEKPLTPNALECEAVVAYCESKKVQLMDGFMWPHHPRTKVLRQLLDSGEIGRVEKVIGAFTFLLEPLSTTNIRLHKSMGGGGLLDVGCYPVFGIRWAFGEEPVRAYAKAILVNQVDVSLNAVLTFEDGRMASFDCGFTEPFRGWLEIIGKKGVICVSDMWVPKLPASFSLQRGEGDYEKVVCEGGNQIVHMLEDFNQALLKQIPVWPSATEAIKSARVMDAILRSVESGKEESIVR